MDARRRHPELRARSGWLVMRYGDLLQAALVVVALAHGTPREQATKARLEQLLASYDLRDYTFTQRVVIEEGVINHAFPTLTLNVGFADSSDELLSSYVHEQIHGICASAASSRRPRS